MTSVGDPEPTYPVELAPEDLTPYRASGTGVDHVHTFSAPRPGPHVMVNALTHGNELCGMAVVKRLLDLGVRPRRGRLTLSFANVVAYERFDPRAPDCRYVDRDFNRLWHDEVLAADRHSVEARRAHEMRPVVATVDRLLDLHSTWHALLPFFVLARLPRSRALADELALPARQLLLPEFRHEGWHLIDDTPFSREDGTAIGLIAECGQHFARATAETAWQVALRFLVVCGSLDPEDALCLGAVATASAPVERYEIVQPVLLRTDRYRLLASHAGFVEFRAGARAGGAGDAPLRAPFDGAILIAPRPRPQAGQQAFAWGRRVDGGPTWSAPTPRPCVAGCGSSTAS
ncbi:MAG: succinylglutamate desuccinylase [Rubrivivax sp.]